MPSELENAMARFRRQLLQQERAAASAMVRAYGESWARIRADILRVQAQLAAGDTSLWRIQQDARLRSVQAQIEAELRRFAPYAAQSATQMQQAAIQAAQRNAGQAIEAAGGPSATMRFDKLNAGAVESMVGFASDGSPLQALFDDIGPDVAPRMTATLAKGIALGWNPRVTAREMRAAYGVGLNRALTMARTETLRAYREATSQVYQANADILEGWIWVCACDRRSCASCWAMHGSLHDLDERLDDHPNGRCAMAPKVRDRPNRIGATGAERFAELPEEDQRYILGPGMYEAWKDGRVSLTPTGANSIVGRHTDPQWGTMRHARSLRDVVGPEAAQMYSARAAGNRPATVAAAPVPALPPHIQRIPENVRQFIPDDISKDLPTTGRLADLANEALAKVSRVERERWEPFNEPGPDGQMAEHYADARPLANADLMRKYQIYSEHKQRLITSMGGVGMTRTQVEENPAYLGPNSRSMAYGREIRFRREWGEGMRQLSSLAEGNRRGVLVLTSEDVTNLLGQVRDRYVDTGLLDPKRPKHVEYSPEVFITSDLSGARARYYIVFPDGQIGHPDEIAEARQRGRIVVIGEIKTPPRTDWGPQ